MSTATYDLTSPAPSTAVEPVRKRKSLFARLMEVRQKQADLALARHGLRLPRQLEEAGLKLDWRNEDSLPFIR
jgi:hypothetical protein